MVGSWIVVFFTPWGEVVLREGLADEVVLREGLAEFQVH